MNAYVSTSSENPVKDAISQLEKLGYQKDTDDREYYFEADEDNAGNCIKQIYCDDECGDGTIYWYGENTGRITPSDKLEISFTC